MDVHVLIYCLHKVSGDLRDLHSFPTRRSSDLSSVGGVYYVIREEETGLLRPRGDAPAFRDAVIALLRDREKARRIGHARSEEHTSELQSLAYLVCRLLLEKKKKVIRTINPTYR